MVPNLPTLDAAVHAGGGHEHIACYCVCDVFNNGSTLPNPDG